MPGDVSGLRQTLVEDLTGLGFSMTQKVPGEAQLQLTLSESAEDMFGWLRFGTVKLAKL